MTPKSILIIVGLTALTFAFPVGYLLVQNHRLAKRLDEQFRQTEISGRKLTDSLLRSESKIANTMNDLRTFAEANKVDLKVVEDDLRSLRAQMETVTVTHSKTQTIIYKNQPSDSTTPQTTEVPSCPEDGRPIDIHGFTQEIQHSKITDSTGLNIADVSFNAAEKNPWGYRAYGIKYSILTTTGRTSGDRVIVSTELVAENPETQPGERFRITGVESVTIQAPLPSPRFRWWAPKLHLSAIIGPAVYPEIDLSLSLSLIFTVWAYGDNWRFLGVSTGYDTYPRSFRASLFPFLFNLGGVMPLISDLWIGLDIGISHEREVSVGIGIATTI